jgi:ribonucleoside-diphosphate reductase alpha chain
MKRDRLPDTRSAITHRVAIGDHKLYITVGIREDGRLGELFTKIGGEGDALGAALDAWATLFSVALQYGIPADPILAKIEHMRFQPSGLTDNPQIRFAASPLDYIAKWIRLRFPDGIYCPECGGGGQPGGGE